MKRASALLCVAAIALVGCKTYGNDEGARYLQRKDTVTLSAGDANQVNAVAQTIHPWPPGVGDRRIPMQGTRAARAMDCYKQGGQKQEQAKGGFGPTINVNSGGGSQSTGGGKADSC